MLMCGLPLSRTQKARTVFGPGSTPSIVAWTWALCHRRRRLGAFVRTPIRAGGKCLFAICWPARRIGGLSVPVLPGSAVNLNSTPLTQKDEV